MNNFYDDIINLPHHVSVKHPQMSMTDRAAQFSPFAALVGFEATIAETNRQTDRFVEYADDYLQELNDVARYVTEHIADRPLVEITYFSPDESKDGGTYKTESGRVKSIDYARRVIIFTDRREIGFDCISDITLR